MKPHNDWEKLMKDKWESQAVEFNEQHWKAMEAMLDQMPLDKPKGFVLFRYRWTALLLLLLPLMWWLTSPQKSQIVADASLNPQVQVQTPLQNPNINTPEKTEKQSLPEPSGSPQAKFPHNVDIKPNTTSFSFKNESGSLPNPVAVPQSRTNPQAPVSDDKAAQILPTKHEQQIANVSDNLPDKKVELEGKGMALEKLEKPENQIFEAENTNEKDPLASSISTISMKESKIGLQAVSGILPMQPRVEHAAWRRSGLELFSGISLQNQSYTVSPTASLRYHYALARRLSLQFSAAYAIARDFPNIVKETNQTNYGLGFENTAYRLTTKSLHFAELGMGLRVPLMRSEFFGGLSYARLIYASASLQTIESNSFGLKGIKSENVSGYTLGLRKNDLQLYAGYGLHLSRRLKWQFSAHYGTRDLTDNTYFAQPDFHRNIQIRTGLALRLK